MEDDAAIPLVARRGQKRCTGLPLGLCLVAVMLTAQQAQNEMFRFQETNTTLTVPVESIYMNHGFLVWMFVFAWALRVTRSRVLPSPLDPLRRFISHATMTWSRSGLVLRVILLEWCMFVPNVTWVLGVERVLPTLSIAIQQSSCVFVYVFALTPCLRSLEERGGSVDGTTATTATKSHSNDNNTRTGRRRRRRRICAYLKAQWWSPALAVVACTAGVIIVCFGEAASGAAGDGAVENYLLLFVNPILIAAFDLLFAKWSTQVCRDTEDVLVLMGCMGMATWLTCWPALFLEDTAFRLPSPISEKGLLLYGNSVLATCFNLTFMVGLSIMGPLFISVGSVLQLPLSILADFWLHDLAINVAVVVGCISIMSGFFVLSVVMDHSGGTEHKNARGRCGEFSVETSSHEVGGTVSQIAECAS